MRTHEEFMKEREEAHDCEKCHGKIFCVSIDALGITHCAYCKQIVFYPKPTIEEINTWMREK